MINYKELKFKAGLEIHQQLDTKKLFCNCDSVLRKDEPEYTVKRKLHAVAGEGGEIDISVKHQMQKDKEFIYQGYDSTCLIELDEEPPHQINLEALKIAMQIALLMNMKIVPITQIMRKTIIDGSNTSGFQRTVMIARDGYIETEKGKVGIYGLFLEEDSARNISREENVEVYRLDRLGIPLVEVVTSPDIKDSKHAKEVALKIGDILRSCKVRRGIGTIRQDVNVSIRGENRVEIKGMQDMDIFVETIDNEIIRQMELSDNKTPTNMEVRNAMPDKTTKYLRPLPGSARMYPETDLELLKISRDMINDVKKNLPKLKSEIEEDLKKQGLTQDMIKMLFKSDRFNDYKDLLYIIDKPQLIAKILLILPKEIATKNNISLLEINEIFNQDILSEILIALHKKKIEEGDIKDVMDKIAKGININEALNIEKEDSSVIEEKVMKIINEKPGLNPNAYMGLIMKEFNGKISGKDAMILIQRFTK